MKDLKKRIENRRGTVLILAMVFVALLSALSISMVTMSSANAQLAVNHRESNKVMSNAQSGIQIIRYMLEGMAEPNSLQEGVEARMEYKGLTGLNATYTSNTITLTDIPLSATDTFSADIKKLSDRWQADITGTSGGLTRTVRVEFDLLEQADSVFDFGVATKGPLLMSGDTSLTGFNLAVESDVFIDTSTTDDSFAIGNQALVEGTVHIVDPYATYNIGTKSEVGGETGLDAENNIIVGVDPVEFPVPNPEYFRQFVSDSNTIDSSTDLSGMTQLNNVIIAANTNPTFANNMIINGVLFVEQPNNVKFAGKVEVNGVIVGNADVGEYSTGSSFDFAGQVTCKSNGDPALEGSFLIAPSSMVDFTGQSNLINGVIACGGARFTGQAGGVINGSIINYSSEAMLMQGQGTLSFNRTGTSSNPAGFEPVMVLDYDPESYKEIRTK